MESDIWNPEYKVTDSVRFEILILLSSPILFTDIANIVVLQMLGAVVHSPMIRVGS